MVIEPTRVDLRSPRGFRYWGGLQRDAMSAQMLAATNAPESTVRAAGSDLRESYSAYRLSYDIARRTTKMRSLPLRSSSPMKRASLQRHVDRMRVRNY